MNNGKIIGTTTQTLAHPVNPTVRIATTMTLPSIKDQIQPLIPQSILKQPNQYYPSFPHTTEHLTNHSTQITTTNVIFDYLLYLSINAKIDQAKIDVEGQQPSFSSFKKVQGVEAIVEGLLQSHQIQTSSLSLPLSLKHRLYLCQLLHLVFDRSHIAVSGSSFSRSRFLQYPTNISNPNPATSMPSYTLQDNQRPTTTTTTVTNNHHSSQKQRVHKLPTNLAKYEKHFKNALLSRCRKHRQSICTACQQHPSNSSVTPPMSRRRSTPPKPIPTRQTAPGLIDAIPVFLNTSAITYRLANDGIDFEHDESMTVNQSWYDLLLDLLTQAAIECYLCDSYNSIDALLEIFSYGDIDPSDYHSDDSDSEDDDPHTVATRADDYLLWQRTTYLDEFRQKKKVRMEEFLNVKGKFEQHFENLANKYSVRGFEAAMLNYCQRVMGCLKTPTLIEGHKTNTNYNELPREILSGRYNGGIDIPMSDEEDLEDTNDSQCESNDTDENNLKKRRLSDSDGGKFKGIKKKKSEDTINNHHHQ